MAKGPSANTKVAIACQGGGSQTAFTAGVLKGLLERQFGQQFEIVGVSGTSGGAVCAALVWFGFWKGDQPRWQRLIEFWKDNTAQNWIEQAFNEAVVQSMRMINRGVLPAFQLSPSSPFLKSALSLATFGTRSTFADFPALLRKYIDFDEIAAWGPRSQRPVLIIGAANVTTGKLAKFISNKETIRLEHILASCCVPNIFPAVQIGNELYWDGLFSDNPPVEALMRPIFVGPENVPEEIWVIKINPTATKSSLEQPATILDRRNQVEGNISLFQQLDHIEMLNDMLLDNAFRPEYLAKFDIKAPIRIPKSFSSDPDQRYHIPCIEMPMVVQETLDYEGKIDRSARNIDYLIELGEASVETFLAQREAAIGANPDLGSG
jgi:NTE family protein